MGKHQLTTMNVLENHQPALHQNILLRRITAKFVPQLQNHEQKQRRTNVCRELGKQARTELLSPARTYIRSYIQYKHQACAYDKQLGITFRGMEQTDILGPTVYKKNRVI
ncbi:hypothetical protein Trydic_g17755 [Trypoxylus dichotomus]